MVLQQLENVFIPRREETRQYASQYQTPPANHWVIATASDKFEVSNFKLMRLLGSENPGQLINSYRNYRSTMSPMLLTRLIKMFDWYIEGVYFPHVKNIDWQKCQLIPAGDKDVWAKPKSST
jgi:hypothetical protein